MPTRHGAVWVWALTITLGALVLIAATLVIARWAMIRHAHTAVSEALDTNVVYVGSIGLEKGIGIGFQQQLEILGRLDMITYYYRIPGGDIFMRPGDSQVLLRYNP